MSIQTQNTQRRFPCLLAPHRWTLLYLRLLILLASGFYLCSCFVPISPQLTTNKLSDRPRISSTSTSTGTAFSSLSTDTAQESSVLPYNWKEQWYALTYASYVPNPSKSAETVAAAVFGHPLVLWKSRDDGPIHCADDVCPHRQAALSEGRTRDGKLECYYHGWQFQGEDASTVDDEEEDQDQRTNGKAGACTFIPQLSKIKSGATIPKQACLKMRECRVVEGIVWVWMGEDQDSAGFHTKPVPTQGDGLDPVTGQKDGCIVNDFQIDLPYDHSYLVENLLDPAHIPISHDRTPGGGRREKAEAYDMLVDAPSMSPLGFTGRFRLESQIVKGDPYIEVQFEAPGIIRQKGRPRGQNSTIVFGAALHCMPLALGRSRLLFRAYFGGLPPLLNFLLASKPEFLRHLNSCKILEQDVGLITTQEDYYKRNSGRNLRDDFLLLQNSDLFIKAYRQWLDRVGHGMPWFQGLASRSENVNDHLTGFETSPALDPIGHRAGNHLETRYHRHVIHCPTTRTALRRVQRWKQSMLVLAASAITLSCGLTSTALSGPDILPVRFLSISKRILKILVPLIPVSCISAAALHQLEKSFFVSFKRKEQLRTDPH
jgi:phenylpropionate dioxygenase-like ring-hydroxylating dioxygenase large terminal subunit